MSARARWALIIGGLWGLFVFVAVYEITAAYGAAVGLATVPWAIAGGIVVGIYGASRR